MTSSALETLARSSGLGFCERVPVSAPPIRLGHAARRIPSALIHQLECCQTAVFSDTDGREVHCSRKAFVANMKAGSAFRFLLKREI